MKMALQAAASKAQSLGRALHSSSGRPSCSFNATTLGAGAPFPKGFATTQHAEFERQDNVAFVCDGPQEGVLRGYIQVDSVARRG